ncbi:restriction endonuclease [Bradyrhizobium sp. BWC-3-1]|uniref:restriction endonuclease n=1 Tax=Bradyrhizobium sp. BWC-3-1 TaxID=3080012 RepID=UPI00293EBE8A|nr:restriction endonuclease [Bradyrhizobium sp. BWC-3-1]WOH57404.1 restriction endonuclease [Bradyrhizobium sp. BWC-3-1]
MFRVLGEQQNCSAAQDLGAFYGMFSITVWHEALGKYQVVRGRTEAEARMKAELKKAAWNDQYAKSIARTHKRQSAEDKRAEREALKDEAAERTEEAEQAIAELGEVLTSVVNASPVFQIDKQRVTAPFSDLLPKPPKYLEYPREPKKEDWTFVPQFNLLDKLFAFQRNKKVRTGEKQANDNFLNDYAQWSATVARIKKTNEELHQSYQRQATEWTNKKVAWEASRDSTNAELDAAIEGLRRGDADKISWLFENVWNLLPLPDDFVSGEYQLHFDEAAKTLIVDLDLPEFEKTPSIKGFRYVASRGEIEEVRLKESAVQKVYDDFVYQLALAVPHAIFSCDSEQAVQAIVLNGWVTYVNRANGNKTTACIVSLHCEASELLKINLREVDPKTCFRSLKGVASPQINSLTPVRPIINVDRSDKRFVNSHDVIDGLGSGANIAAIGWEEFEHLIRQLFEKEFSTGGGEVKVTQASRDGGVDAVAFDPDPIRGGKIVIQAKRYTNTVDVSAVRDLYGTVLAEGATKGIIVTTSGFGPDAHRFAKGKPLTLLDGNNLLYLLAKHGTAARIDLAEAKRIGNALMR